MGTPHQGWLVVNLLSLRQAQFNSTPTTNSERFGGNSHDPTRVKQIGYCPESVGSRVIGELALRFESGANCAFQTRFRIWDKEPECNLPLLPRTSHDPGIDSVHNKSEVWCVTRNLGICRIYFDAQRSDQGRIHLRGQLVGLF